MIVHITLVENEIREAISQLIEKKYGLEIPADQSHIETKSKQNFKSEWEQAAIRVDADCRPVEI